MINDQALRDILKNKISLIKEYPRSLQKKVEFEMAAAYNVKFGDTVDIFNGLSPNNIEDLPYHMLFKLMKCIYKVALNSSQKIDSSDLYAEKYFTPIEIQEFDIALPEEDKDFDLVITNWIQRSPTHYKIFTNIDEVTYVWRNNNKLRFNPETQRDLIVANENGKKRIKLDINRNSVEKMKKLMKKNLYFNVTGTININPEVFFDCLPYKRGKDLIIPKEAHMDLIEGFHNYIAETEVKDENPDWKFDIEFDLRFMNVDECNMFISQMNEKNHFRTQQAVRIDKLSEVNYIIDTLNKNTDFHLYGTIAPDIKVYLNKCITNIFGNILEREESINLLPLLIEGLNIIIKEKRQFNSILSKKDWIIYLAIIKHCRDKQLDVLNVIKIIDTENAFTLKRWDANPTNCKKILKIIKEVIGNEIIQ